MPDMNAAPSTPAAGTPSGSPAAGSAPKPSAGTPATPPAAGKPTPGTPTDVVKADYPAGAGAAAAQREKRRFEFEIDGEKIEREFDDDQLKNELQLSLASRKRMNEAVQALKQSEQFVNMLKDPRTLFDVLRHPSIGLDVDQVVRDYVSRKLELERMDPREREMMEMKERYELQQRELEDMKHSREREEIERKTAEHRTRFLEEIQGAITQTGLPKSDYIVRRMAKAMIELREQMGRPVKAAEVVDVVKREYEAEMRHVLGSTSEDSLFSFLGEDIVGKIRQADLKKAQSAGLAGAAAPSPSGRSAEPTRHERRMMTPAELEEEVRRRIA